MRSKRAQSGFTLLEVLVAGVIMAIAVTGLLSALSTSLRNAAKLTDYDRATLLARQKMDELLVTPKLPKLRPLQGQWDTAVTGGVPCGWIARVSTFDKAEGAPAFAPSFERIELTVWWQAGDVKKTFTLEGFRRGEFNPEEAPPPPAT